LADDFKTSVRRFVRQPAVTAVLVGVGALTVVVVLRGIRRR
jgi:hypothetical protein